MRRMSTLDLWLSSQLKALPGILETANAQVLARRPLGGGWSAHEILAHLARYHEVFLERVRQIIEEDRPHFSRYRAEEDPDWPGWAARTSEDVLDRMKTLRGELIGLIRALPDEQLARVGVHQVFGPMSLERWLEFFLAHEGHHLYVLIQRVRST